MRSGAQSLHFTTTVRCLQPARLLPVGPVLSLLSYVEAQIPWKEVLKEKHKMIAVVGGGIFFWGAGIFRIDCNAKKALY